MKSASRAHLVLSGSQAQASAAFALDMSQAAHLMEILRGAIYTDKVTALLREYGTNGLDAHQEAGKPDVPLKIVLPTVFNPTLIIRDFGLGMSQDQVLRCYTQYGYSSKRESNEVIGMLGIGCKAAFCMVDAFTVISYHGGFKSVYMAVLDPSNQGLMNLVSQTPCGDETGIEIRVPIKVTDVDAFHEKAKALFPYFKPQPVINTELVAIDWTNQFGFINPPTYESPKGQWVAVMGCCPYRINMNHFQTQLKERGLWTYAYELSGGIVLPLGTVEFSASREELQYTDATMEVILEQFHQLVDTYVGEILTLLSDETSSQWERRMSAFFAINQLRIDVPAAYARMAGTEVRIDIQNSVRTCYRTHIMTGDRKWKSATEFGIHKTTRIVVADYACLPLIKWHGGQRYDVIISPRTKATTVEEMKQDLAGALKEAFLDGIPIVDFANAGYVLKSEESIAKAEKARRKYSAKVYQLTTSGKWEVATPPEDTDFVSMVIFKFEPVDREIGATYTINNDRYNLEAMGGVWPPIFGFKKSAAAPITQKDIPGTPYLAWLRETMGALWTGGARELAHAYRFVSHPSLAQLNQDSNFNRDHRFVAHNLLVKLELEAPNSPITEKVRLYLKYKTHIADSTKKGSAFRHVAEVLESIVRDYTKSPQKHSTPLPERYGLTDVKDLGHVEGHDPEGVEVFKRYPMLQYVGVNRHTIFKHRNWNHLWDLLTGVNHTICLSDVWAYIRDQDAKVSAYVPEQPISETSADEEEGNL